MGPRWRDSRVVRCAFRPNWVNNITSTAATAMVTAATADCWL